MCFSVCCFQMHLTQQLVDIQQEVQRVQYWNWWPNVFCYIVNCLLTMDKCPICYKGIQQHARKITCCICYATYHMKYLSICQEELKSLECNRSEWFCEMCLSHLLPFNFIEDNNDFYAAVQKLSNSTADSLRYVSEKVFQPFESDFNEYEELNDIDPDFNFYNAMSQNRCCNYYLESSFNNMINKTKEKNIFSLCHLNIRSMKKNIAQFESFLDLLDHDFTVVGLTETWLNDCDCHLYKLDGYSIVENHRECRVGGGVALLIRDWLTVAERDDICVYNSDIESVFVEIDKDQIRSSKNIVIGTSYRPPGQDIDNFNFEINKILDKLHKENKIIYIMGDFNINLMNSDTHTPTGSFLDLMYSNMLFPLITRPTRMIANSATLIDNIFTNNTCGTGSLIQGVFVTDITDHYPIFHIDQELTCVIVDDVIVKRIYDNKNMREFSETLSHTDWSEMYTASGTQEAFDLFHNKLMELHNKHFPKVRIKKGYSNRKPWLSEALRDCIKRKNKMYYVFKKVPSVNNENCYKNTETNWTIFCSGLRNNITMIFSTNTRVNWESHGVSLKISFIKIKNLWINQNFNYQMVIWQVTKRSFQKSLMTSLLTLVQRWPRKSLVSINLLYHIWLLELMGPFFVPCYSSWTRKNVVDPEKFSYGMGWNKCNVFKDISELYKGSFVSYMQYVSRRGNFSIKTENC